MANIVIYNLRPTDVELFDFQFICTVKLSHG
jgi:hypothetical protein